MKSPAYQWYPKDILSSERVAFLSLAEEGAYRRALDYCWLQGSIPSDPNKLATLIGKKCTAKIASAIIHLFQQHPDDARRLIHDKQENYRAEQEAFRNKQSQNGKKGGRPKNPDESQEKPKPSDSVKPKKALHSASSSASSSEIQKPVVVSDIWFEMFRRACGPQIDDDTLVLEIGKFRNKYPNLHPNQAGSLINAWVGNIGRIEAERAEAIANPVKKMVG